MTISEGERDTHRERLRERERERKDNVDLCIIVHVHVAYHVFDCPVSQQGSERVRKID